MRKKRATPTNTLLIIVFTALLPINVGTQIVIGWNDEGAMPNGSIPDLSKHISSFFLSPMHGMEHLFHKEIFTGNLFFIADISCMVFWTYLAVYTFRFTVKLVRYINARLEKRRG